MTLVQIHLTRHGEVHNPDGILYGRLEGFGLSERGRAMADRLVEHFTAAERSVRLLVSSPLQRAQETLAPLAAQLELEPRIDERVIEAENAFEGTAVNRGSLSRPQNLARVYNPFRPSWGEPYLDQVKRMRAAMASLRVRLERAADEAGLDAVDGVIVSHQLPIWVTRLAAERRPLWHDPRKRECALGSVTTFTYESGRLIGVEYENVCADLQPAKAVTGA
ncbi:histidine phosphatase family protein [Brevibacterium daeguense]|uniref:Histidine phosphatase family protein n=1 Tax=Brevibacterium daeguense TaxID=909936 RepID=A0ABP8EL84_9MICO|nr:histidine phosphatase family protein [Brevibacterium daeguense]